MNRFIKVFLLLFAISMVYPIVAQARTTCEILYDDNDYIPMGKLDSRVIRIPLEKTEDISICFISESRQTCNYLVSLDGEGVFNSNGDEEAYTWNKMELLQDEQTETYGCKVLITGLNHSSIGKELHLQVTPIFNESAEFRIVALQSSDRTQTRRMELEYVSSLSELDYAYLFNNYEINVDLSCIGNKLSWSKHTGGMDTIIYRKSSKQNKYRKIGQTDGVYFIDATAKKGIKYKYKIKCRYANRVLKSKVVVA